MDALILVVGLLLGAAVASWHARGERRAREAHVADLAQVIVHERQRTEQLAQMLDEARAKALGVSPPVPAQVGPATAPLPAAVLEELEQLEDEMARTEFEAVIRAEMQRNPTATAEAVLAAVMPGRRELGVAS